MTELDPEDVKLVRLARASRSRVGGPEGAAVRDLDGRTYAAATVSLPSLRLSALETAVAMAVSSGATGLEAAAVVEGGPSTSEGADPPRGPGVGELPEGLRAVRDLGGEGLPVVLAGPDGQVREVRRT